MRGRLLPPLDRCAYLPGRSRTLLAGIWYWRRVIFHPRKFGTADLTLDASGELRITPRRSAITRPAMRRAWRDLARAGRLAGLHALTPLASEAEIGRGYHSGATVPMAKAPGKWQSDVWGRPARAQRVHCVDASVWTDIPSGPVTLTAMANAHRIAFEAARLD